MNLNKVSQKRFAPKILISKDENSLAEAAAAHFIDIAADAIATRGCFSVLLSGGSTPERLYKTLALDIFASKIDWSRTHIFWEDERYVPPSDSRNNFRMTNEALLSKIPIPAKNVHRVMTEIGNPNEVAEAYEKIIREFFAPDDSAIFDLTLLGVGENGHIASLFPHSPLLHESQKLVAAEFVREVDMWRITTTLPVINNSREIVFLALGKAKAQVIAEVICGEYRPEILPAQLINLQDKPVCWIIDSAAASLIPLGSQD